MNRLAVLPALLLSLACSVAFAATPAAAGSPAEQPVVAKDVTPQTVEAIRHLVHDINPQAKLKQISDSPFPGIKTVVADASVMYASEDGRYLFYGVLLDTKTKQNLTDAVLGNVRVEALASIPAQDVISFKPKHPKYVVTAFTDTSCGYCQLLFKNTQGYLAEGIQINYVPWPRAGMQAPNLVQMQSVWCAKDPVSAYSAAMNGQPVPTATCKNSADFPTLLSLGEKLGINGTPAVFDRTGRKIGGFMTPAQMLAKLQELDHQRTSGEKVAEAK